MKTSRKVNFKAVNVVAMKAEAMSTLQIAELTGKDHKHVLTDTRKMLTALGMNLKDFECRYLAGNGENRVMYKLPEMETLTLVSGYDVKLRYAIIQEWNALKSQEELRQINRESARSKQPLLVDTYNDFLLDTEGRNAGTYELANLMNSINKLVLGTTAKVYREHYNIPKNHAIRDYLLTEEVAAIDAMQTNFIAFLDCNIRPSAILKALTKTYNKHYAKKVVADRLLYDRMDVNTDRAIEAAAKKVAKKVANDNKKAIEMTKKVLHIQKQLQFGDSYESLAEFYNVTVPTIKRWIK